jgi:hypothetical protein
MGKWANGEIGAIGTTAKARGKGYKINKRALLVTL